MKFLFVLALLAVAFASAFEEYKEHLFGTFPVEFEAEEIELRILALAAVAEAFEPTEALAVEAGELYRQEPSADVRVFGFAPLFANFCNDEALQGTVFVEVSRAVVSSLARAEEDVAARMQLAVVLARGQHPEGLQLIRQFVANPDPAVGRVAAQLPGSIAQYPHAPARLVRDLAAALPADGELAAMCVTALYKMNAISVDAAVKELVDVALHHDDHTARLRAATALKRFESVEAMYQPIVGAVLRRMVEADAELYVRYMAGHMMREEDKALLSEQAKTQLLTVSRSSVQKYAYSWWNSANHDCSSAYTSCTPWSYWGSESCGYSSHGGDCADFVSQSLIAGGFPSLTGASYCRGYPCGKEEVGANNLDNCLQHKGWSKTCSKKGSPPSSMKVGDVIVYHTSSCTDSSAHATVVTQINPVRISCHSSNHKDASYTYITGSKPYISFLHAPY